jgi:hypothetical protein
MGQSELFPVVKKTNSNQQIRIYTRLVFWLCRSHLFIAKEMNDDKNSVGVSFDAIGDSYGVGLLMICDFL